MKQRKVRITMGCGHGSDVCDDMTAKQLGYLQHLGFCENCFDKAKAQVDQREEDYQKWPKLNTNWRIGQKRD